MSLYSAIVGYDEPQMGHFEPGPIVKPRMGDPKSLTTHNITLPSDSGADIILKLKNSQSPDDGHRPLYYSPCTIEGEIAIDVKKDHLDAKALVISLEGIDHQAGYSKVIWGQGNIRDSDVQSESFWHTMTPNLLHYSSETTATLDESKPARLAEGAHTFPFSLEVPDSFVPSSSQGKNSLKAKLGALFGHHKDITDAEDLEPKSNATSAPIPLPPSFLRHEEEKMDELVEKHAHDDEIVVAEYTIGVRLKFGGLFTPDMFVPSAEDLIVSYLFRPPPRAPECGNSPPEGPGS
ncbi:hypothetical protein DL93DRAFT_2158777 [Clavulina sp. PMI_390]|nr:hypothetical protein DL93DRAFT_2158777 [Clavulina sp. PMI_390]